MEPRSVPTSPRHNPRRLADAEPVRRDRLSLLLVVVTALVVAIATSLTVLFLDPFRTLIPSDSTSLAPELVRAFREGRERLSTSTLDALDRTVVNLYERPAANAGDAVQPLGSFRGTAAALSNDGWFVTAGAEPMNPLVAVGADRRVSTVDRTVPDGAAGLMYLHVSGASAGPLGFADATSLRSGDELLLVDRGPGDLNLDVERVTLVSPRRIDGPFVRSSEVFSERLTVSPERRRSPGALVVTPDLTVVGVIEAGDAVAVVPARTFAKSVPDVVQLGIVARPYLGVRYVDLSSAFDPDGLDVTARTGALLSNDGPAPAVVRGSPAFRAGFQAGDRITHVNDEPVDRFTSLTERMSDLSATAVARLRFVRNGESHETTVTLVPLPTP